MQVQFLDQEDPLEESRATHFNSGQENPMDRGVWEAVFHRVAKCRTQLKQLSTHSTRTLWVSISSYVKYKWMVIYIEVYSKRN